MDRTQQLELEHDINLFLIIPTVLLHYSNFIMVNSLVIKNRNSRSWSQQNDHALYVSIDPDGRKFACLVGWTDQTSKHLINPLKAVFTYYDFI